MNTLKKFIDNQAEELLQQSDLADLTGGISDYIATNEINTVADCSTTINNCHGANCVEGCGSKRVF